MSQRIQVRRGTDASRRTIVLNQGEPAWTTDSQKFFIGDGNTYGGLSIADVAFQNNESFTAVIPISGSTARNNASGLHLASLAAAAKMPYGSGLSSSNRYAILLYPGIYDFAGLTISSLWLLSRQRYVDFIGVGNKEDIRLRFGSTSQVFGLPSGHCNISNLTFENGLSLLHNINQVVSNIKLENVNIYVGPSDNAIECSEGILNNCYFNNLDVTGNIFGSTIGLGNGIQNSTIKNSKFYGTQGVFIARSNTTSGGNRIENCDFYATDRNVNHFLNDSSCYGYDKTNIFKNCYFSGTNMMYDIGSIFTQQPTFENCRFDGNFVNSFDGIAYNCIFDSRKVDNYDFLFTIGIENHAPYFPRFNNCTVLSKSTEPSVSGVPINSSGLFAHCRFNRPVATGVTGLFGNMFNLVHPSIQ